MSRAVRSGDIWPHSHSLSDCERESASIPRHQIARFARQTDPSNFAVFPLFEETDDPDDADTVVNLITHLIAGPGCAAYVAVELAQLTPHTRGAKDNCSTKS